MCRTLSEGFKGHPCDVTTNPADRGEKNLRGSVQVEMEPNVAELQCFVTPMLLQLCVHGLQWMPHYCAQAPLLCLPCGVETPLPFRGCC